mmetsp:Transcript_56221/g.155070  ORF Transcript_56221/g.155070 Transcript_56221/m.155070 type:complete len:270 (+) Transcript_56221:746-1555(+)
MAQLCQWLALTLGLAFHRRLQLLVSSGYTLQVTGGLLGHVAGNTRRLLPSALPCRHHATTELGRRRVRQSSPGMSVGTRVGAGDVRRDVGLYHGTLMRRWRWKLRRSKCPAIVERHRALRVGDIGVHLEIVARATHVLSNPTTRAAGGKDQDEAGTGGVMGVGVALAGSGWAVDRKGEGSRGGKQPRTSATGAVPRRERIKAMRVEGVSSLQAVCPSEFRYGVFGSCYRHIRLRLENAAGARVVRRVRVAPDERRPVGRGIMTARRVGE